MHCDRNPRRIGPALLVDEGDPKPMQYYWQNAHKTNTSPQITQYLKPSICNKLKKL
jgi:hypothetical protein